MVLSVRRLSVRVGGRSLLSDVRFELPSRGCLAVRGPSGAGKSLMLRAVVGLVPNDRDVWLDGEDLTAMPPAAARARVVYVPQTPPRLPGTLRDNLMAVRKHAAVAGRVEPLDAMLRRVERLGLDEALDRPADQLSGGEAQRMGLVRALQLGPRVLLLDEPTSALDSAAVTAVTTELQTWLADTGGGIVWVAHSGAVEAMATDHLTIGGPAS